jgi:hypothetical protein
VHFCCAAGRHVLLGWFINGKWANIMHFLGCVLCLAFSVAWDQVRLQTALAVTAAEDVVRPLVTQVHVRRQHTRR